MIHREKLKIEAGKKPKIQIADTYYQNPTPSSKTKIHQPTKLSTKDMGNHQEIIQVQAHVIERIIAPTNSPPW